MLTLRGDSGPRRGKALGDLGIIENGAILIKDGHIVEAGPSRRVEKLAVARRAREIDASGRVVMPGFVDSHTHLIFGKPRLADYEMRMAGASYAEIAAAGGGIIFRVVPELGSIWTGPKTVESGSARYGDVRQSDLARGDRW